MSCFVRDGDKWIKVKEREADRDSEFIIPALHHQQTPSSRWLISVLVSIGLSGESRTEDDKISTDQSRSAQTHSTSTGGN